MFVLTRIHEKLRIPPEYFDKSDRFQEAIEFVIHGIYCNRVLPEVGLCICVYDILSIGEPYIYPGDGAVQIQVMFRLVVFRPMLNEVLTGKILSCDKENGIRVSLGKFYDDVIIPPDLLQPNTVFSEQDQQWMWVVVNEANERSEMYMELNEPVRFKVQNILFDQDASQGKAPRAKSAKELQEEATKLAGMNEDERVKYKLQQSKPPMIIQGRINEDGLGLTSWWSSE